MLYIFFLAAISLALLIFALFFVIQFYNMVFRGFAPFISSTKGLVKKILESIEVKAGSKIYELGSGKATFLREAEKKFPDSQFIGIEYSFLPYLLSRIQLSLTKSKIKIKKENIFKTDLHEADIIYCYLNIKTMAELEKKFISECKPGAQIISNVFQLPNQTAEKVLEENANKVYFYKM
jgi:16S rRNA A1518/A1519 N6-dimethyltransferase RsmA/KsgA/DIM1 with predicted DNA glycosylase/AP lyase activity